MLIAIMLTSAVSFKNKKHSNEMSSRLCHVLLVFLRMLQEEIEIWQNGIEKIIHVLWKTTKYLFCFKQ